jgi:hypothetical protein
MTMTTSIPREVNGKWYPVPLPEGTRDLCRFDSEAECAAFLLGIQAMRDNLEDFDVVLDRVDSEGYDRGYEVGYKEGKRDAKQKSA